MIYETIKIKYSLNNRTKDLPNGRVIAYNLDNNLDITIGFDLSHIDDAISHFNKLGYFVCGMKDYGSVHVVVLMTRIFK